MKMEEIIITFKYIELFAGIGGFRQALDPLGGECVFASEIDKYASQAYRALYDGAPELHGDITKIDAHDIPDHDVLVGGFPCQAFSVAGQRKGFEEARGTLFFEIARIASAKQPRLMLLENVKGLLSHDGGKTFETMCAVLNDIGYAIDFNVLNSKYFGVPQNRERIFIVCSRDAEHAEWDVKGSDVVAKAKRRAQALGIRTFNFEWPTEGTVTTRLRDVLEAQVDEKYYLSEEKTAKLIAQLTENSDIRKIGYITCDKQQNRVHSSDGIMPTITANNSGGRNPGGLIAEDSDDCEMIGHVDGINGHDICRRVYSPTGVAPTGVAPTIPTGSSGNTTPKIAELQQYSDGSGVAYTVDANYAKGTSPGDIGKGRRTHVIEEFTVIQKTHSASTTVKFDETGTLQAARLDKVPQVVLEHKAELNATPPELCGYCCDGADPDVMCAKCWDEMESRCDEEVRPHPRYRIRKLTPRECWRLQGFSDAAHDTVAAAGISDSQRYKQAGNAVTVNVISAIGKRMMPLFKSEVVTYSN